MKTNLICILFISFFTACTSTTTIHVSDPQVKVYVDDSFIGTGVASHSDTKIVGSNTSVRLEKEGCNPTAYNFSRSENLSVGALIGGILLFVPFLWIMEYKPSRSYEFYCVKKNS
jgi:hypothetical protein